MKYSVLAVTMAVVLFFGFSAVTPAAINEGFDGFDTGTRPVGWTFTHCNADSSGYTVTGYWGVASPSILLKATTDAITSCEFGDAGNLSFWLRSLAPNPSSTLRVEQLAGTWSILTDIIGIPDATAYSVPALALNVSSSQVRFTYTKVGAGETKVVIDDVQISGAVTPTPTPAPALAPTPIHLAVGWDDYNGDGYTDYALNVGGTWNILGAQAETVITEGVVWGDAVGDVPAPGDYDGDGNADIAYYNRISSEWNVMKVTGEIITTGLVWGAYGDMPVPEDYDGDGTTDYATLSPIGSNLYWHIYGAATAWESYGYAGDIPMVGDYDGDGTADKALVRPQGVSLRWLVRLSGGGSQAYNFGYNLASDWPTALDYDGDGVTDAVIRRTRSGLTNYWFMRNIGKVKYGLETDTPVGGDFDGNGEANIGVFRGSDGTWYIYNPYGADFGPAYGADGDLPVVGQSF